MTKSSKQSKLYLCLGGLRCELPELLQNLIQSKLSNFYQNIVNQIFVLVVWQVNYHDFRKTWSNINRKSNKSEKKFNQTKARVLDSCQRQNPGQRTKFKTDNSKIICWLVGGKCFKGKLSQINFYQQ